MLRNGEARAVGVYGARRKGRSRSSGLGRRPARPAPTFPAPSGRILPGAPRHVAIRLRSPLIFHAAPFQVVQGNPVRQTRRFCRPALTPVAQRSGVAVTAALIRISTDIEINGNEQPEAISVAGKDIRCPSQVTPPASFVASCVGGTVTFRSELSASPRPARSGSPARRWLTVDRNPNAWKACSDG